MHATVNKQPVSAKWRVVTSRAVLVNGSMELRHKNSPHRNGNAPAVVPVEISTEAAFGYPRDFLNNRFVYLVISPRAKGLSIGVNLNPVVKCTLNCLYCEVDRERTPCECELDVDRMGDELRQMLLSVTPDWLRQFPRYARLPEDLLQIRHVALSGDGEPTLSRHFVEAVQAVAHVRALLGFFKVVLLTNSMSLHLPEAQAGLRFLTSEDEIWAKLDGGTQQYLEKLNGGAVSLQRVLENILLVGRRRPVVIQSLFPAIDGKAPSGPEIHEYAARLKELKEAGANITLVQIYSATRPMHRSGCSHLPLKILSQIAATVRNTTGLRAEVY